MCCTSSNRHWRLEKWASFEKMGFMSRLEVRRGVCHPKGGLSAQMRVHLIGRDARRLTGQM